MSGSRLLVALALIGAVAALSGCGRKTALDTPYQASVDARKDAQRNKQPLPPEQPKPVEDRPFILDPLL
ncbi:MAG: lipoprotein [Rhizobiaceae bacterium]|nr:lipoprotein [Rhizobiaceae bacterium]